MNRVFNIFVFSVMLATSSAVATLSYAQDAEPQPVEDTIEDFDSFVEDEAEEPALGLPPRPVIIEPAPELADEPIETDSEPIPLIRQKKDAMRSRFRQESRFIEHPNAEKGLIKIDKDRNYIYRVKESEQTGAASFRVGTYSPDNLENPDGSNLSFVDVYSENDYPMVQYDYEKQFFQKFGKLAYTLGIGFYFAQGEGQFENPTTDETPLEKFTLFVFPISVGLVYRAQFWDYQFIVPYAGGGFDYFAFAERRDDDLNPDLGAKIGGAPGAHFNLGASIRLGRGARSFLDLDREYGINSVWITGEYRSYLALSDKFDFSSDFIGAGIYVEY